MAGSAEYLLRNNWLFNDGSGSTVADSSDSNNLTVSGSPTWGADYLSFNGTAGEYCTTATNWTSNNTIDPRYDNVYYWLVKLWFRTTSASGTAMWGMQVYTQYTQNVFLGVGTDGKLRLFLPWVTLYNIASAGRVDDGEWHEAIVWSCSGISDNGINGMILDGAVCGRSDGHLHTNSGASIKFGGGVFLVASNNATGFTAGAAINHSFVGDIKGAKAYWWNDCIGAGQTVACCEPTENSALDLVEWKPPVPANALMFSCNT